MTIQPIIGITGQVLYHHYPKMQLKECGNYIVKEKDEIERVWVTYTTCKTYHDLCKNHMSEFRSKKKD